MDWDSTVFNLSDNDDTKLTYILSNVIKISDAADLIKRKEDKIREIEMTVDNVDYVDDGTGSLTRSGEYTNWFTYCAPSDSAKVNTFNMASTVPVIRMPHMGTKHINEYSTEEGSVYNVRYVPSEYAPNTMMLHFEVKEKGGDGFLHWTYLES